MHQNRWRLGLGPDPTGGAYSAPQTPSWIQVVLLLSEGRGGEEGRAGEGLPRLEIASGYALERPSTLV